MRYPSPAARAIRNNPAPTATALMDAVLIFAEEGSGGFCWQGQIYSSLSTIARRITGTSWNGPHLCLAWGWDPCSRSEK